MSIGWERKIGYSFVALIAGDAVATAVSLLIVVLLRLGLFTELTHVWNPASGKAPLLLLYIVMVSILGWAFVGLPVVLPLRAERVADLYWAAAALIGTIPGLIAMLLFVLLLDRGFATISNPAALRTIAPMFVAAALIASVAFTVYCSLIKAALRRQAKESGAPSGTPRSLPWFQV
jgi:hypothetical protein